MEEVDNNSYDNANNNSISEETKQDYMDAFNMFDTNHDGTITSQKLGELMRKLGQNPSDDDLIQMIESVAKPGSKKIGFDEFVDMMEKKNNEEDTEVEIIKAFRVFDTESNGLISNENLAHIIRTLGETLTDKEIEEIVSEADVDGDGFINYEEFVRMMMAK